MLFYSVFSLLALSVASVNAHGYVKYIKADGKTYNGPVAGGGKIKSPIRQISTTSPWKDPNGAGITCGRNAQLASQVATVTAGSQIELAWVDHPGANWQHDMGPLITYMAKVPAGQTADKFNAAQGNFFKVSQVGQAGKKWTLATLMTGATHKVTVPKGIENGDYIMRHEIIALHLADKKGGAEFYTSCFQLRVTGGTGNAKTTASRAAKFPGGYSASDPGIFTPKVFDSGFKYTFPGPLLATFSNTGIAVAAANAATSSISASTKPSTTIAASKFANEPTSSKAPKPTGKVHAVCRRSRTAGRSGWSSRT